MITGLVWLIVVLAVLALCWWAVGQLPLPPVVKTVTGFLLAIIGIVVVGKILIGIIGGPPGF